MSIIDFYDDIHGRVLRQIGEFMPDYVANSELKTPENVEDMPMEKFAYVKADGSEKKLPIDNRVNTWLSSAYFVVTKDDVPPIYRQEVQEKLASARHYFDVKVDMGLVKIAQKQKPKEIIHWGLPKERLYPLENKADIDTALEKFASNYSSMTPEQRVTLARVTVQRANELQVGVDLSSPLMKYAHTTLSPHFDIGIKIRNDFVTEQSSKRTLTKIALEAKKTAATSDSSERIRGLDKLAAVIKLFDIKHGLHQHWDSRIPDPAFTVFSPSVNIEDHFVDEPRLMKTASKKFSHDVEKLRGYFDDEFVDSLRQDPEKIASLTDLQRSLVVKLLKR